MYQFLLSNVDKDVYQLLEYQTKRLSNIVKASDILIDMKWNNHKLLLVIDRMNIIKEKYPSFDFKIKNKTFYFNISKEFSLNKLYSVILEETIYFNLLDMFFREKYETLEKISQQYFFSDRTIQRKLKEIGVILDNYKLKLNLKSKKVLQGEEYRVRYFFHTFYWQKFDENDELKLGMNFLGRNMLEDKLLAYDTKFRHIDIIKFKQIISISFFRIQKGNIITTKLPKEMTKISHGFINYKDFKEYILDPVAKQCGVYSKLNENEYLFLYYMFCGITTYLPRDMKNYHHIDDFLSVEISDFIEYCVPKIEKEYQLKLMKSEINYLIINMNVINSTSIVFSTSKKIDPFGSVTNETLYYDRFPNLYSTVKNIYHKFSKKRKIFDILYKGNNRIIFQYTMLFSLLVTRKDSVNIFHESKFGKIQDENQKNKIQNISSRYINFVEENPDIVITDYPVSKERYLKTNKNVKFIQWESFDTIENWLELIKELD